MDQIIVPSGMSEKQFDAMMKGKSNQPISIQVPKKLQEAQKKYYEDGIAIYSELCVAAEDNLIADALRWLMKSQLPFDQVQHIDELLENEDES